MSDPFDMIETDELPYDAPNPVPKDLRDTPAPNGEVCDICGRDGFKNARGLSRHKTVTHGTGSDKTPSQGRKKTKSTRDLQQSLEVFFSSIGIAVTMANQIDGAAIINGTPGISSALANTAEHNPKLRKVLESLTSGFAYSELIAASAVIVVPILANHNLLPERFGMAAAYLAAQNGQVDYSQAPQ